MSCACDPVGGGHYINCPFYNNVTITYPTIIPTGWQCPKCQVVHAPSVLACYCASISRYQVYPNPIINPTITWGPSTCEPPPGMTTVCSMVEFVGCAVNN